MATRTTRKTAAARPKSAAGPAKKKSGRATTRSAAKKTTAKAAPRAGAVKTTRKPAPARVATTGKGKAAGKTKAVPASAAHLPIGSKAPAFTIPTDADGQVSLADFKGRKNVVLYFYPKDDTPGCTVEACDFQKNLKLFDAQDTVVIGVSPDPVTSHARFRSKYNLQFILASDEANDLAKKYGAWGKKNLYGREYMGIQRSTVIIDRNGRIAAHWPKVKVSGHVEDVLEVVSESLD